jgi:hypothetical protein
MERFDNTVKEYTTWLDNPYVSGMLTVFLIVYASMVAPKLPSYIANLFDYTLFKLAFFFLIIYTSKRNPTIAIVGAVALLVSIMTLERIKFGQEMMSVVNVENRSSRKVNINGCDCDCPNEHTELLVPTHESVVVTSENRRAEQEGSLYSEEIGAPILVARTEEGLRRMEEAPRTLTDNLITSENPMSELAQEVLRRKHVETERRGGASPSMEELQGLCSQVLNEHRRSASCGSSCGSRSQSDVSANDNEDSDYAPVDEPTLGLEKRMERLIKNNEHYTVGSNRI